MSPTLLGNRYQVLQTLGAGGFGTTFLAEDTQMPSHRKCVIKQLKPIANNPEIYQLVQERFQREAAILEDLGDANGQIPRLYAYFAEGGHFYLIQEWIEGVTLREKVKTEGVLGEQTVRQILIDILPVLNYVHSKHIVHRDIKPDNIILRKRDGKPVLIDFGAVRETMGTVVNSQGETGSSIVIGTPGFMPSEQAAGRPMYSSDLYSLGLTMIYLLTGKFPQELELDSATGEIVWRKHAPSLSPSLAGLLDKAIQYHPRDRFPSAQEMLAALQKTELPDVPNLNAAAETAPFPPTYRDDSQPPSIPPTQVPAAPPTVITPETAHQPGQPVLVQPTDQPPPKTVPDEIPGWNWGAFLLPGFWCINNQVWLGLLSWTGLITGSLGWWIMAGLLGAKGNEWAWKSRHWRSVEAFKANQRNWAIGGILTWGSLVGLIVAAVILAPVEPETGNNGTSGENTPETQYGRTPASTTTNVFGSTETLSEPTTYLDGNWRLSYSLGGVSHEGTLRMQGTTGTLITKVFDSTTSQTSRVQQTMRLWNSPRGLVVLGYNPVNLDTQEADATYAADNLLFERQADGSFKVTNCDDVGNCTDVAAEFTGTNP